MTNTSQPSGAPGPRVPGPRTTVFGVLGGIAAGKSAVAALLAGDAGVVIDADRIARAILESDEVKAEVVAAFGRDLLRADGTLDRERLGRRVFASASDRERLERFTHPRIRARIRAELEAARARRVPRIVLDVPLLFENDAQHHLVAECDVLVFVDADERDRDARAVATRGWSSGEVALRERTQLPLAAKRARAQHVVHNNGSRAELSAAVARILSAISGPADGSQPDAERVHP